MRPIATLIIAHLWVLLFAADSRAAQLRNPDDAALHAVQVVDGKEGWAVGDEGVVWHTIDGGRTWERQSTGTRASLRSLHFLDPYFGWVAGREELPGGGSAGVILYTQDGGLTWKRVLRNSLPPINRVCFADDKTGYLAGDGSDAYPSGLFVTHDAGRTWQPIPGPRCPAWYAADFNGPGEGALAGAWNRQATVRRERLFQVDSDILGGRTLRGLVLRDQGGIAVGEGGLVLLSEGSKGASWNFADLKLPPRVGETWDFHAVHGSGAHYWVVGRPGSVALHSPDRGRSWEMVRTGQPLPLHGVWFSDEQHGWVVGELGVIVATADGGKTWRVQHRGGDRAAVLVVNARAAAAPLDAVAALGARDGYLVAGVRVAAPDPTSAAPGRAGDGARYADAFRQVGGASAEALWPFPLPSHLARAPRADLLRAWDQLHGDRAAEQLLRQIVLSLRLWRPDVILADPPAPGAEMAVDDLVGEAVRVAFTRAGDPEAFPEQLKGLGLEPWRPAKLYAPCDDRVASATVELGELETALDGTIKEFVCGPMAQIAGAPVTLPARRGFRLLAARIAGAEGHRDLMQGIELARGGLARRPAPALEEPSAEAIKAARQRLRLLALAEAPATALAGPERLLGQVGPMIAELPDDQAARTAHAVAWLYARRGQWAMARETFQLMADRYPAHPLALDACRWLVRHNSSSEARRRHELGQFLVTLEEAQLGSPRAPTGLPLSPGVVPADYKPGAKEQPRATQTETKLARATAICTNPAEANRWYQSSLDLEARLAAFGPLATSDPSLQFCLQAARRNLGDAATAQKWFADFAGRQPDGPWRSLAQAELWLARPVGQPPRPALSCRRTDARPHLDGKLDDPCWDKAQPVRLQNAVGDTVTDYPTAVRMSYDPEFLYLAIQCKHPTDRYVETVKPRTRGADLRRHDRVSILLDLDRDYCTYYHLQIDQRGLVCEDCWGDKTWSPRWFVAVQSTPEGWIAEAAIPLVGLTGDSLTPGKAWACNVVRIVPGRGVQAFSLPAEAPEESLRPEGMGLLLFQQEPRPVPEVLPASHQELNRR